MRITLIRHGKTDANEKKLSQGFLESILVEKGIKQANYTSERLKSEHFDAAYSGDLIRAYDTAKISLKYHPNVPIIRAQSLNEQCKGKYEGWTRDEREKEIKQIMEGAGKMPYTDFYHEFRMPDGVAAANTWNNDKRFYNGESLIDTQNRMINFHKFLLKEHKEKDNVLLVSSGMAIGCYLTYLRKEQLNFSNIKKNHPKNSAITVIEAYDISNPQNVNIPVYDDTSHLPDDLVKKGKLLEEIK